MSAAYGTPGSDAALCWMFAGKVWSGRAVKVVADGPERTLISWWPGCESWHPEGLLGKAQRDFPKGSRWEQVKRFDWELVASPWTGTRVLSFFEPEKYYAISLFWDAESGAFRFYYVNFQLPFTRSHAGFDSLDLDLDIVVAEDLSWQWKDEGDWVQARASGGLEQAVIDAGGRRLRRGGGAGRGGVGRLARLDPPGDRTRPGNRRGCRIIGML